MEHPFLLFVGDETNIADAKTASGIAFWRPDVCAGQLSLKGGTIDLGLPEMTLQEAAGKGVKTLMIGIANEGGYIPDHWIETLREAVHAGLHIASGLHARLNDIPELKALADEKGLTLTDVRHPDMDIPVGSGEPRTGKRLLTVGTDCAVGKMYAVLALEKAMKARGMKADFRATGQTGIFIAGKGVPIDAVVADFVSGAAEQIAPSNTEDHWDLIEGQGSLFHPSYAAVTLGLIHGSQPDAMVLCHKVGLDYIDQHPAYKIPDLAECMRVYEQAARLTNKKAKVIGLSFNTSSMEERAAIAYLDQATAKYGMPAFDPVRTGVDVMVDHIKGMK